MSKALTRRSQISARYHARLHTIRMRGRPRRRPSLRSRSLKRGDLDASLKINPNTIGLEESGLGQSRTRKAAK